jgi:hypothetical protein
MQHSQSDDDAREVGISVYGTLGRKAGLASVGGTMPLPPDYKSHRRNVDHRHLAVWPLSLFVASLYSFTWYFFWHPAALLIGLGFVTAGCILVMFTAKGHGPGRFIALCSLMGLLLGAPSGWYIHEKRVQYWYALQYGQHYSNVVPTQLAAAHSDASVIGFEAEASVDIAYTSGYRSIGQGGHVFCAAPITTGGDPAAAVQFFAVGRDCCKDMAPMTCDGVGTEGRHTGIVVHDFGILPSRGDHYRDAVRLAAATWDLAIAEEPIMVRWVQDSEVDATIGQWKSDANWLMAGVMIFGLAVLYYGISMGLYAIFGGTDEPLLDRN